MKKLILLSTICFALLSMSTAVFAQSVPQIQTNSATNIQSNSATLNANVTSLGGSNSSITVWFQWGTTTAYGNQTPQQNQGYLGSFSQTITGLVSNTTYHFQVVARNGYGTVYGQDTTFYTSQYGTGSQQNSVSIVDYSFNPLNIQINVGDTVVWTNNGQMNHTVTSDSGYELNSSTLYQGSTYSHTFSMAGTFPYHCTFHSNMHGTVTAGYNYNNNIGGASVQTNSAANIFNNSATLNGYLSMPYISNSNYVWFQYGNGTNYGSTTPQQALNYSGSFSQVIANLSYNTVYHFRAAAQGSFGTIYGQDMIFNSNGSGNYYGNGYGNYYGSGTLTVTKQVINLTSGNLNWSTSVNANPGDVLAFAITMQANGGQDIHNVFVRDVLPSGLVYRGNMTVNASLNYAGDPISGINVGTIPVNGVEVISYQAQVVLSPGTQYGIATRNNSATITSAEGGTQTVSASVVVNNSAVLGATDISTGMTNNPITDSFFLPIMLIILGAWFYFSGNAYRFADRIRG